MCFLTITKRTYKEWEKSTEGDISCLRGSVNILYKFTVKSVQLFKFVKKTYTTQVKTALQMDRRFWEEFEEWPICTLSPFYRLNPGAQRGAFQFWDMLLQRNRTKGLKRYSDQLHLFQRPLTQRKEFSQIRFYLKPASAFTVPKIFGNSA